jgi:hypothetical protein
MQDAALYCSLSKALSLQLGLLDAYVLSSAAIALCCRCCDTANGFVMRRSPGVYCSNHK